MVAGGKSRETKIFVIKKDVDLSGIVFRRLCREKAASEEAALKRPRVVLVMEAKSACSDERSIRRPNRCDRWR